MLTFESVYILNLSLLRAGSLRVAINSWVLRATKIADNVGMTVIRYLKMLVIKRKAMQKYCIANSSLLPSKLFLPRSQVSYVSSVLVFITCAYYTFSTNKVNDLLNESKLQFIDVQNHYFTQIFKRKKIRLS